MNAASTRSSAPLRAEVGMTLIELMVALAIGMFLMIGAMTVFQQSRTSFRITESVSRLQENARFALDAIEPDIRMAHYWGLTTRTGKVQGRLPQTAPNGLGPATCGSNWAIDLDYAIRGTNGPAAWPWGCAGQTPAANSDTLVVRHAGQDALTAAQVAAGGGGALYIQSARALDSQLFKGTAVPGGYAPGTSETHRLVVNGYYVSTSSLLGAGVPSLHVKTLTATGVIQDQEVLAGVEDMQVQFGVDTDPEGSANRGSIDRYVNVDDPMIDPTSALFNSDAQILAVRIWLRVRAERTENGFTDTTRYQYAGQDVTPNDGFRRVLISKTIYLRNAQSAT